VRFHIETRYSATPNDVAHAYADPALYAAFVALPRTDRPEVLGHRATGDIVELQVRWRFSGELPGAARRVIDPDRLTWVETSRHDVEHRRTTFRMVADHYADRLSCAGEYRFSPAPVGAGTVRIVDGELKVKAPLVAKAVEQAIISGIEDQLRTEVAVVDAFLG
jgi:hypothetical protein